MVSIQQTDTMKLLWNMRDTRMIAILLSVDEYIIQRHMANIAIVSIKFKWNIFGKLTEGFGESAKKASGKLRNRLDESFFWSFWKSFEGLFN